MKKLNIAIIGFGRSGCDIHGAFLRTPENDICNVKYVVEADPNRAAAAREIFGCETVSTYQELFAHKDELDFVTNASYSDLHYPITKDLMEHGFNVLCEKPLCKTPEMVQDLIDTAKRNNVIFTIFHQYKFNDYYIQMKRLLKEGVIGAVKLARVSQNAFARRYDWQTLLYRDAGTMHEMEVNPSDAYASDMPIYKIYGTKGTMKVYNNKIVYKYYLDEEVPTPELDHRSIHNENGTPAYCNNKLVWHEEEIALKADVWNAFTTCTNRFYHAWYETLVNGAELFMKPEHIKAQIAIFNEIERQNPLIYKHEKPDYVI